MREREDRNVEQKTLIDQKGKAPAKVPYYIPYTLLMHKRSTRSSKRTVQ